MKRAIVAIVVALVCVLAVGGVTLAAQNAGDTPTTQSQPPGKGKPPAASPSPTPGGPAYPYPPSGGGPKGPKDKP